MATQMITRNCLVIIGGQRLQARIIAPAAEGKLLVEYWDSRVCTFRVRRVDSGAILHKETR